MGVSFADIGLMGQGSDQVIAARDAAIARQLAIQQQQRQDEDAQRKLEDERRAAAYMAEVRSVMPQYLAGGSQGIAGEPEQRAQVAAVNEGLDTAADEPTTSDTTVTRVTPAKPAQDNNLGMMEAVKNLAVKHGRMADYEAMNTRVKKFQDEGVLDFIKQARSGATDDQLLDTFNKTGKVKLARLHKVEDGVYAGATKDGKAVSFDLDEMTEAMLAPKDYLAHQDKSELTDVRREASANTLTARTAAVSAATDARQARLDAEEGVRRSRERANESLADQRDARAAGGGQTARTSGNWNQFDSQVKSLALSRVTAPDPDTGKDKVDRTAHVKLTSMAQALARQQPDLSPGQAVEAAAEKLDEIRQQQEEAQAEAEKRAQGLTFTDDKQKKRWVASQAKGIAQVRSGETPGAAPTKAAPTSDLPRPASRAEFEALPPGTKFINPADGSIRIKK